MNSSVITKNKTYNSCSFDIPNTYLYGDVKYCVILTTITRRHSINRNVKTNKRRILHTTLMSDHRQADTRSQRCQWPIVNNDGE